MKINRLSVDVIFSFNLFQALDYAKNVPKPKVNAKIGQTEQFLSPKGSYRQNDSSPKGSLHQLLSPKRSQYDQLNNLITDSDEQMEELQRLRERHEMEREKVAMFGYMPSHVTSQKI